MRPQSDLTGSLTGILRAYSGSYSYELTHLTGTAGPTMPVGREQNRIAHLAVLGVLGQ